MINIKDFMEVVNYRITDGNEFGWPCFGADAYCLNSWNGEDDGHSISITFDTKYQAVYMAEACDYKNNRAYRLINPDFSADYYSEAHKRDVNANQAWDDVDYVDLDSDAEFLEKTAAIVAGEEYDSRVPVEITMPDSQIHTLMRIAHERDITLNQLVEEILKDKILTSESQ